MSQIPKHFTLILLLNLMLASCTKAIDFSQAEDLEITPILESSLLFFNEPVNRFLNNGNENTVIQDFVLVEVFNEEIESESSGGGGGGGSSGGSMRMRWSGCKQKT